MHHSKIVPLCMLAITACTPPPRPPEEPQPPEPIVHEDPIAGDPAAIEREEIGEERLDSARIVEPGPAEAEVRTGSSFERPD
jgi:hypothetical protein